jgi:HD-like signal output (HDOD) protein
MNEPDDRYRALRPSPPIATKLLRLLEEDNVSVKNIVDLIRADAALTAELLRLVNSPNYGFSSAVSRLRSP